MDSTINLKIFTGGRLVLTVMDDFHEVELFSEGKKLKKGYGYIKDEYVYIYRGKKEKFKKSEIVCGIYMDKHGEYEFVEPSSKQEREAYSTENVIELDIGKIFEEIAEKKDDFIDPEDIEIINNNSEIYIPSIKEKDDFLKYAVKKAILDKKVNLKNYRNKFSNQYALNNMKSGLNKETKMTVTNYAMWCEILGLKWKLVIEDDGTDRLSPLPETIELTSEDF
jgi:hypothetical protein